MPVNLSIKGVPEALAERLRARAERNHRSLQGELMAIVWQAAVEDEVLPVPPVRAGASTGTRVGSKTIEETIASLRALYPKPIQGGPLGVDIIRADRDSR